MFASALWWFMFNSASSASATAAPGAASPALLHFASPLAAMAEAVQHPYPLYDDLYREAQELQRSGTMGLNSTTINSTLTSLEDPEHTEEIFALILTFHLRQHQQELAAALQGGGVPPAMPYGQQVLSGGVGVSQKNSAELPLLLQYMLSAYILRYVAAGADSTSR